MLCFCPSYNMVLLFGVKHMLLILTQYSNYRKRQRELSHFSPAWLPLPMFNDSKLLRLSEIFEFRLLCFVLDSVNKTSPSWFHDFFLFSSSVHQYSTWKGSQGDLYRWFSFVTWLHVIRHVGWQANMGGGEHGTLYWVKNGKFLCNSRL